MFRKVFDAFVSQGSDSIDKDGLRALFVSLRMALNTEEFDAVWTGVDTNRNGKISWDEFDRLMKPLSMRLVAMLSHFKRFDENNDGYLSKEELIKVGNKIGMKMDKGQLEKIMNRVDANHDGLLDYREILDAMPELCADEIVLVQQAKQKCEAEVMKKSSRTCSFPAMQRCATDVVEEQGMENVHVNWTDDSNCDWGSWNEEFFMFYR